MIAHTFTAMRRRLDREYNDRATQAWITAGLSGRKRLPPLQTLLLKDRAARTPQTWQEQRDIARMITASYGGKVRADV
jgi:hypothetical protein